MRHLFVVDSLDKHIQNEKELIRPRRLLPAARATRARSAQFYVVLIRHDSTGVGGLFCICVESINLNLNLTSLLNCSKIGTPQISSRVSPHGIVPQLRGVTALLVVGAVKTATEGTLFPSKLYHFVY